VLLQAGSSGRGRDFAARWAELVFTGDPGLEVARTHYQEQKEAIAAAGRDPGGVKMLPMVYTVVGESHAHAEEREDLFLNSLVDPQASLCLLSELMNYDFSGLPLDAPITDELIGSVSGIRGLVQNLRRHIGGDTVTLADLAGHRATLLQGPRFVGTGAEVADQMGSGWRPRRATASPWPPPTPRAPMRTSCAWSSPSCSAAACSVTGIPVTPCATPWAWPAPTWSSMPEAEGPLHGVRVVDAATLAAGPLVATAMGEFGADVIKVEQPGAGDPLRTWGERKDEIGLVWKSMSRNKRCVTLDLRQTEGQELFHGLLEKSDVLVVGNRPSAMVRWGIDYGSVHERHPHLVMLHVSGYGRGGPKSDSPGFGTLAEAMSGFAHLTGQPDGPPTLPPFMLADGVAALAATYAVMMALYHRDVHGGGGQLVDVNLIEPLARLIESSTLAFDQLGKITGRVGNRFDASAPRNAYRTSDDKWLAISSASPNIAARVYRAIDRPDLAENPDYVDSIPRQQRAGEVDKLVSDWVATRTLDEAMAIFEAGQVAAAPIYDAQQLMADGHLVARGTFVEIDDPDFGTMTVQAPVAVLTETPGRIDHLGRPLGADSDAVFTELLGIDPDRLVALRASGVI
jgi:crotonobetainyl-CoA:carnitine CoA-transferase CaiB-like acyl-CoA transferase